MYSDQGLPWWLSGIESACQFRRHKRCGLSPWVGKIPWRRAWQPTPVFLPGEPHGQQSLVDYSPWGHKRVGHDLATKLPPPHIVIYILIEIYPYSTGKLKRFYH